MRGAVMRLTAAAAGGVIVLLLTVPVVQGQNDWRVTYTSTQICALKGSTVDIQCTYRHRAGKTFWFSKESNNVFVDLRTDPDYAGRVQYRCENSLCTLRITDLRESDSAVYYISQPDGTYAASPGVTLTVADLQVQVRKTDAFRTSLWAELECHSSCPLPGHPSYVWYENGQKIHRQTSNTCSVNMYYAHRSYSCAVRGHENSPSPSLSMQGENGWGVTYSSSQICGLTGSTVDIHCTYRYPFRISSKYTVQNAFWFRERNPEPEDLKTVSDYKYRVQYSSNNNDCTLTIRDLRESDSAEFKFRFIINLLTGKYTGSPGVTLSVTDPQLLIHVRRSTVNEYSTWTELTCHNNCPLPDRYSYIWYKNGQKVQDKKVYFHPHPLNPADNYSCAVQGHEMFPSPTVYAPRRPSVSVSPSAEIVEGSSVNLTCSSDANPAASITWYKRNRNQAHQHLSEQPQLVLSSIQFSDSGGYYCTAENKLGSRTSENLLIDVRYAPKLPSVSVSPSAEIVEGSSVTLTCSSDANPAANITWYKENQTLPQGHGGSYHFTSISSEDRGIYYCKSENQHGSINSSSVFIDVVCK
ncbi:B-cell receptor CD22-like [Centropristis striata]|uniref:B-cell receptor CD22-like n=1 Tax=Centropristis striata TaxID=184440 RepID=UPI0027E036A6|nr:B-cell receptor CD22-like [Centropristis striata]